jgi:hypothetical protein
VTPLQPVESSRSAIVDSDECARLRLLGSELDGTGYAPRSGSVATLSGIHIHEGTSSLLTDHDIELATGIMLAGYSAAYDAAGIRQASEEHAESVKVEQMWVLECMLRGWHRKRYPNFMEEYEVMSTERQWRWELAPGITLPFRMDAIVRRRDDNLLHIVDFKGTSNGSSDWMEGHENSRQTILYLTALEEYTGEHVGGMVYEGLIRGGFKFDGAKMSPYYGRKIQQTPYAYGYRLADPNGCDVWQGEYTSRKGYVKTAAWEHHTPTEWLDQLDREGILEKLFIAGTPVNPPPALRQSMRRQIAHREREWFTGLAKFNELRARHGSDGHPEVQEHLEMWAPQIPSRCNKYGEDYKCPFKAAGNLCFLTNATELLREDESFQRRIPHHAPAEGQ